MKFANAGKLDRKSGVRFGEPGAPVLFPVGFVRPKVKLQIPSLLMTTVRVASRVPCYPTSREKPANLGHPIVCCEYRKPR
jgi:hypothetical protein